MTAPTRRNITSLAAVVLVAVGCDTGNRPLTDAQRAAIAQSVDSATQAFAEAERQRDPARILAHLAPEFYLVGDGVRVGYDSVAAQIRRMFPTLQRFETTWSDVEVTVLGDRHALVTFLFRDVITDQTGATTRQTGPTTLVWERRGSDWLIIYADAVHYPDSLS